MTANGNKVTGQSVGEAKVTISAGGQTATVDVRVTAADSLAFNQSEYVLQAGQPATPAVMATGPDGQPKAVQAPIESMDKNVVDADPAQPGQFVARSQGQTQFRAVYRGKELFAKVTVSGRRFETVTPTLNDQPGNNDQFTVTIEVLAAATEGGLEYRVYEQGANPKENWVPNQVQGEKGKVTLGSDPLKFGPRGQIYHLVVEARDKATQRIEKYPLNLQLGSTITVVPNAQPPTQDSNPGKDTK